MEKILKNIDIINALGSINELIKVDLPIKVSWALTKNMKKLITSLNDYDEAEKKLINEYAEKDDNDETILVDNKFKILEGKEGVFIEKKTKLLDLEDILDIHLIKISELDGFNIKGSLLYPIQFMIDDSE